MVAEALEGPVEGHVVLESESDAGGLRWAGGDGAKIEESGGAVDKDLGPFGVCVLPGLEPRAVERVGVDVGEELVEGVDAEGAGGLFGLSELDSIPWPK